MKCLTGLALVLGQAAVLTAALAGLRVADVGPELALGGAGLAAFGLVGLGWGLLFSADGSNVLQVIGQAIGGQAAAAAGFLGLGWLLSTSLKVGPFLGPFLLVAGTLVTTGLTFVGSRRSFSRLDRLRTVTGEAPEAAASRGGGWRVLVWLSWRQAWGFALGMMVFSLAAGLLVLASGTGLWPAMTLLAGVLCGVTVFSDEQAQGAYRFLGDQRFPPGHVWLVKTALRGVIAVASAVLVLLPSFIRAVTAEPPFYGLAPQPPLLTLLFHDDLLGALAGPAAFLGLWLLHGFGFGVLSGLLFRKSLVAGVLGFGASAVAASVWLPSLAGGGLHLWQVAGVPLLALAATRLLLPAWAAGRLASRETARHLLGVAAAAALWTAGALGYRVVEVPDVPDPLDMPAYVAELAVPSLNEGGQLTRNACDTLNTRLQQVGERRPGRPPAPGERETHPLLTQALEVVGRGWGAGDKELDEWLKKIFDSPWHGQLEQAADLPEGWIEDPRRLTLDAQQRWLDAARNAGLLLSAHGVWRQAEGDPAAFVADLRGGLALARNLRHRAPARPAQVAREVEDLLLAGLDRWLERLDGRPDLLRQALDLLRRHEAETPTDVTETLRTQCLVVQNTLQRPADLLIAADGLAPAGMRAARAAAVALAWHVPWEQARQERTIRCRFDGADCLGRRDRTPLTADLKPKRLEEQLERGRVRNLTYLRAGQLKLALRLYQAEKGKPVAALEDLLLGPLPALPRDPYGGGPFRYRVSAGERLEVPGSGPSPRKVPAGQAILSSAGPEPKEGPDGGLIFLVPLPPRNGGT
jgi:hypothetical protein